MPWWAIKRKVPHCCEKKVEAMIVRVWRETLGEMHSSKIGQNRETFFYFSCQILDFYGQASCKTFMIKEKEQEEDYFHDFAQKWML